MTEIVLIPSSKVVFLDKREEEESNAVAGAEAQKGEEADAVGTEDEAA